MWVFVMLSAIAADSSQTTLVNPATLNAANNSGTRPLEHRTTKSSVAESTSFIVRSYVAHAPPDQVAQHCESLCCQIYERFLPRNGTPAWQPKCEVVLHATRQSHRHAVGPAGTQTVGSSLIRVRSGRILKRQIDLLAEDRNLALSALPHELIDVFFAERFPNTCAPAVGRRRPCAAERHRRQTSPAP